MASMQIGEKVKVSAYKSDGTCYRWWYATVEAVEPDGVVLVNPAGHWVEDVSGGWASAYAIRTTYWLDRWYSLLEVYAPGGEIVEIFVNIGCPPELGDSEIAFTDYELDISKKPPHRASIVDADEFLEAVSRYGYSAEFQQACYAAAKEALAVADSWVVRGMPQLRRRPID